MIFLFLDCKYFKHTNMAEKLSNQMKDVSLESDKILGKSLESSFEQPVGLRLVYGKICITLFVFFFV